MSESDRETRRVYEESEQYVTNGFAIGTISGQVPSLYGVVEYEDGSIHKVDPECITFTDRDRTD